VEWGKHTAAVKEKIGISAAYKGWTSMPGTKLFALPKRDRVKSVLDVAWASRCKTSPAHSTKAALAENFWVDASQAVQRKPWSVGMRCLTTSMLAYSFEKDVCLSGYDMIRLQAPFVFGTCSRNM
jgi:hypothetical protein